MILNKIKLEDFISHKRTELDLGLGINVVVGPNGAGKTSILDGISFALFSDYGNRGKKENLINSRARACKVGLTFTEGGICYDVDWSLERRGLAHGSLFRIVDGRRSLLVKDGERCVTPEIQKVLGIDKSLFMQSIYVQQGEIEQLVNAKPAERKTLISKLLGVEDLEKAWSSIRDVIQFYQNKHLVLEVELSRKPELEKQRNDAEEKARGLSRELAGKRSELSQLESGAKTLQNALAELEVKKEQFDKLNKDQGILEQKIAGLASKLEIEKEELRKAQDAAEVVTKLKENIEKLPHINAYVVALVEKERLGLQLKGLDEKLGEIANSEAAMEKNEDSHKLYLEKERRWAEQNSLRKKYEGYPKALESARKQIERCEKEQKKRYDNLTKELSKYSDALDAQVTVENLSDLFDKAKLRVLERAKEIDKKIGDANANIGVLNERTKVLDENLQKFSSEAEVKVCPTCDTELSPERISELVERFSSERKIAFEQKGNLETALGEAEKEKEKISSEKKRVDAVDPDRIRTMTTELTEVISEIIGLKSEIEQLEKQVKVFSSIDADLEQIEEDKNAVEEANKEYELAALRIKQLPSKEGIEKEKLPALNTLQEIDVRLQDLVDALGYKPENPQEELSLLTKQKETYDQNLPMSRRQTEYESSVGSTAEELESSRGESSKLSALVEGLGYDENLHEAKQVELDDVNKYVKNLSVEIAGKEQAKKDADGEAQKCKDLLQILEAKSVEKKRIGKYVSILNKIRDAYGKDGIQKVIRSRAKPVLEKATRDLFERFNLAYSDVRIDDDYNISVIGSSGEQDIDQISGGERVALAIALRLAIAQVLSGRIETVIMDEPTTHLDEERRKELVNVLNSFFREGGRIIPQMLIITHHSEIEEVADIVYSVHKNDGYSTVSQGQ